MRFATYTALNGACSTFIGVLFVVSGFPGLFASTDAGYWWIAVPAAVITLGLIGALALRRGIPITAPGRWLTDRPIRDAVPGAPALSEAPLRRRLLIETVVWAVVALAVIVGFTTSRPFAYATGWASLAYGLLELLAGAPQIRAVEAARSVSFSIRERPAVGTPRLAVD